jgi:F0F1-type ATP synthase membrane subunit a
MNWAIESLFSVGFFAVTQLLGKTNWRAGVPASVLNLATYFVVVFVFYAMVAKNVFDNISPAILPLIIFSAICIYIGNAASVRGFNYAPNPGYSTAIVKSYVVITLAVSIFFVWRGIVLEKDCWRDCDSGKPVADSWP